MKPETAKRLHDAASACDELKAFTADWNREEFLVNRGQQLIVWKLVEIVGEALRQGEAKDASLRDYLPELRDVVDTRNRITHGYDSVDFGLLWDIVIDEMPLLRQRLGYLLAEAS
jgi:uncharacterized protein with HEPN domain